MKKLIVLTILLVCSPSPLFAGITGVVGTTGDGQVVTVNGIGFGSKSSVEPIQWDNFEDGTVGTQPVTPVIGSTWGEGENVTYTSSVVRSGSNRSSRHDFYNDFRSPLILSGGPWGSLYISFWYRTDYSSLTVYNGFPSRNIKIIRLEGDNGTKTGDQIEGVPLVAYEKRGVGDQPGAFETALRAQYYPTTIAGTFYDDIGWAHQTWSHVEIYVNVVDGQKEYKVWENSNDSSPSKAGTAWTNVFEPYMGSDNSRFNEVLFGAYFSQDAGAHAYMYLDDVYVDTTQARVMLCNTNDWNTVSLCEPQIPRNTWTDTSLQIEMNTGTFSPGATAYLYVVDSSGTPSDAYEITVGAAASDTTPPTPVSASVNGTTLTFTANESIVTTGYDAGDCNIDCTTAGTDLALTSPAGTGSVRTFTVASSISDGDTCDMDCTLGTGDIEDTSGNYMISFSDLSVSVPSTPSTAVFALSSSTYTVYENGGTQLFGRILRTVDTSGAATIYVQTDGITASGTTDYNGINPTAFNFVDGEAYIDINIEVWQDQETEGDETTQISISAPSVGELGATTSAIVTIVDDDGAVVTPVERVGGHMTGGMIR